MKVIVCDPRPTEKDCCTCGAAWYVPFPVWFAVMTHVPAPIIDTVEPDREQTFALPAATANVTPRPDEAVAETVYVAPPTTALAGGVEVKLIVWLPAAGGG